MLLVIPVDIKFICLWRTGDGRR